LARILVGKEASPSQAAQRTERRVRLEEALNRMSLIDREMLLLRHFEELTNHEAAEVLEISRTAAHNRYIRALKHLRELLLEMYGSAAEDKL
jgi:RNA polymerase sigma-70 factor (ECF subfamily)